MADEIFISRLNELAVRAARRGEPVFTHFLDLSQIQTVRSVAASHRLCLALEGGYPDAERCIGSFYEYICPETWQWPIQAVQIEWRAQFGSPGHRDLLGALMGLGFERERMGDIVLTAEKAFVFAEPEIAGYIANHLESAGKVSLKCRLADKVPDIPPPTGHVFRDTVASLRLDAVLAAGFSLSRSQAAQMIIQGKVFVNQAQQLSTDAIIKEKDLISLRGEGRVRIEEVGGETRKRRLALCLFRYGERKS